MQMKSLISITTFILFRNNILLITF